MKQAPIILASSSPRRASLMRQMGFSFEIVTSPVSEESVSLRDPVETVTELSCLKADAVLKKTGAGVVIGADTIVYLNGRIFGKPENSAEAVSMLTELSGKKHNVYTGFTLMQPGKKPASEVIKTCVTFSLLKKWEIDSYVASGEPMDKAGAYGIQGKGGLFIERLDGCYYNVVGFPVSAVYRCLKHFVAPEPIQNYMV